MVNNVKNDNGKDSKNDPLISPDFILTWQLELLTYYQLNNNGKTVPYELMLTPFSVRAIKP